MIVFIFLWLVTHFLSVENHFSEGLVNSMKKIITEKYREVEGKQNVSDQLKNQPNHTDGRENKIVNKIFNALSRDIVLHHKSLIENETKNSSDSINSQQNNTESTYSYSEIPLSIWNYLKEKLGALSHSIIVKLFGNSQDEGIKEVNATNISGTLSQENTEGTAVTATIDNSSFYYIPKKNEELQASIRSKSEKKSVISSERDMLNPDGIDESVDLDEDPAFWNKLKRLVHEVGSTHKHDEAPSVTDFTAIKRDKYSPSHSNDDENMKPLVSDNLDIKKFPPLISETLSPKESKDVDAIIKKSTEKPYEVKLEEIKQTTVPFPIADKNDNNDANKVVPANFSDSSAKTTTYSKWSFTNINDSIIPGTPGESMKIIGKVISNLGSLMIPPSSFAYLISEGYRGTCISDPELCLFGISFQATFRYFPDLQNGTVGCIFETGASDSNSRGVGLYVRGDGSLLAQVSTSKGRWCVTYSPRDILTISGWITVTISWNQGQGLALYVNCKQESAGTNAGMCSPCLECHRQDFHSSLTIGRFNSGDSFFSTALMISELEIYDKTLTSQDVYEKCGVPQTDITGLQSRMNLPNPYFSRSNIFSSAPRVRESSNFLPVYGNALQKTESQLWLNKIHEFRKKSDVIKKLISTADLSKYADPNTYLIKKRSIS